MTLLQRQLQQVFANLPEGIRALLLADDLNDKIERIGQKNGLDENQSSDLVRIVVRLLSGIIQPTQFVALIMETLEVPRETAALLAEDINRDIFNPVKDELKEVHKLPPSMKPGTDATPRPVTLEKMSVGTAPLPPAQTAQAKAASAQPAIPPREDALLRPAPPPQSFGGQAPRTATFPAPAPKSETPTVEKTILEQKLAGIFQANTGIMMQPQASSPNGFGQQDAPRPAASAVPLPPAPRPPSPPAQTFPAQIPGKQAQSPEISQPKTPPSPSSGADPYREPLS